MSEQFQESGKSKETNEQLLERCLNGNVEASEIRAVMSVLITSIDNPVVIGNLAKVFLRKKLEAEIREESESGKVSLDYKPITEEHDGDNILKHPDAKQELYWLGQCVQGSYLDARMNAGASAEDIVVQADDMAKEEVENIQSKKSRDSSVVISDDANQDKRNPLAENADMWVRVFKSLESQAPKRDYRKEHIDKMRERIESENLDHHDLGLYLDDLIQNTSDKEKIKRLIAKEIQKRHEETNNPKIKPEWERENLLKWIEDSLAEMRKFPETYDQGYVEVWIHAIEEMRSQNK